MRPLLAIALLSLCLGCAPSMVVPAQGTGLAYEFCGGTASDVAVYRYETKCPDLKRVEERARRVKEHYPDCSLAGVRIFVVNAYVMCNEEPVRGCTTGDLITVSADPLVIPTIEHEFRHVCIEQAHPGRASLRHFDLDNRAEERERDRHMLRPFIHSL